jgi:putative copper resistance protein D
VTLPPYTFGTAVSSWTFDPTIAVVLVLLAAAYLTGVRLAHGHGRDWPWWRTVLFVVLGLGGVVVCTMSSLAVYDHTHLWALAVQLTLLLALVPVGLALGDPVGLARAALAERGRQRLDRALAGPVVRVLTFPVVAALIATTFLLVVFFSDVLLQALRSSAVMNCLYLAALVVGCLAALPLLGAEILPDWCTEPFRLLFAFVDGIFDAVPGILVMTTGQRLAGGWFAGRPDDPNWDVHVAGASMLALSELVALPIFFLVFFRWAAREGAFDRAHPAAPVTAPAAGEPTAPEEPELMRPWWETEGFGARNRPFRRE